MASAVGSVSSFFRSFFPRRGDYQLRLRSEVSLDNIGDFAHGVSARVSNFNVKTGSNNSKEFLVRTIVLSSLLLVLTSASGWAQATTTSNIAGTVQDATGAAV